MEGFLLFLLLAYFAWGAAKRLERAGDWVKDNETVKDLTKQAAHKAFRRWF